MDALSEVWFGERIHYHLYGESTASSFGGLLIFGVEPIISSGVMVWRVWALFRHNRWMIIFPATLLCAYTGTSDLDRRKNLCLMSSIATSLVYVVLGVKVDRVDDDGSNKADLFLGASLGLSLATNIMSTAMIGYVLW